MDDFKPTPLASFLIKVHSRCNLMCDYCYEYNSGNTSWKRKPREMSWEVYEQTLVRVREHSLKHHIQRQFFSFHGGEPLLRGVDFFRRAVELGRTRLQPEIEIDFGTQTNGTLLTADFALALADLRIGVGVSLDGPRHVHDRYRVYSNGDPSFDIAMRGISHLLTDPGRRAFGGILAVINVAEDPVEIFEFLASLDPPQIDFLEPHGTWDRLPNGKRTADDTSYGDWLIKIFDHWFSGHHSRIPIRKFEEIIEHLYGGRGDIESFGLEPVNLVTIATDGAVEAVDCVKAACPDAEVLGLNVFDHSFDDVLEHPSIRARQIGERALADTCLQCGYKVVCGGGYFPHRYTRGNGFRNPTVFCADYRKLIGHIASRIGEAVHG
ncbi:MAG: FxsB family radical SAM/SPASM domain protein [Acidobacteria bacterium]|nr:FxsB family radical SAM/SPASM domain protein [Acidobacteriota bacterium]